jgi:glycosyltransferase involved in cell wall biosynthesis
MNNSALRLLYLLPAEGFGGAERQGVYHLTELPRRGVDVTALVGPGEPIVRALEEANAPHELFRHFPDRTYAPLTALGRLRYFGGWLASIARATAAIEHRMRRESFDLIFANRTFAWLVAAGLSRRFGVPYVIRAGSRPATPSFALGLSLLDRIARPAGVFSNCRAVDRDIASHFQAPRFVVPNAIDTDRFSPGASGAARARLGLPRGVPLIGLAARPSPEKGLDLFARVVARVCARRPNAQFVVAGEFGWRAHYESRLRAAGFGNAVQFLGHVDRMSDFYRGIDVAVLTSRARSIEASPNALLEAMAVARPIVSTDVGGIPELVHHGREGYLTDEDDDIRFADYVVQLLDSPSRRLELGLAGRERAISRHRVSVVVAELARHLRALAALAPTPPRRRDDGLHHPPSLRAVHSNFTFAPSSLEEH